MNSDSVTNPIAKNSKPIKIKIVIPTNVYFLSGLRNFTFEITQNIAGFDRQWAYRLQTIVDELTNNAIRYGNSNESEEIEIDFLMEQQKTISVTVSDNGSKNSKVTPEELSKIAAEAKQRINRPSLSLSGRGFQIVGNWSDELIFARNEHGGISVTATKDYAKSKEELKIIKSESEKNVLVLEV